MPMDHCNASASEALEQVRIAKLTEARALMTAALVLLDDHARSPAAATLDLAVHYLDRELAG